MCTCRLTTNQCWQVISYRWPYGGFTVQQHVFHNRGQKPSRYILVVRQTKTLESGQETTARYALSMGGFETMKISHSRWISYLNHDMREQGTCLTHNNLKGFSVDFFLCWEIIFFTKSRDITSSPDSRLLNRPFLCGIRLPFAPYLDLLCVNSWYNPFTS